ncbi:MAG: AAA family ATPase [Planctomycetota bacterium]|jgi:cytidylate kinase
MTESDDFEVLIQKVRAALEARRAGTGMGFVVVLGSAPRERGKGVKHGVGRSAVADSTAQALGAERFSTGKVFRDMAAERGMSIEAFHERIPEHPEWDADLDRRVMAEIDRARATGRFLVMDSNLAAILGTPDLAARIDVPDEVRVQRVLQGRRYGEMEFESAKEALDHLDGRSAEEARRYSGHPDPLYEGVDLTDAEAYRATVDNSGPLNSAVSEVLRLVLEVVGQG